ncbi:rCG50890 [Rattus norvegicus]|uniref:RCG50890 n=1 Tax=Rattus norvegicus TaxID=10116 RepID=A6KIY5_RAT|nr:rCG50890 [Rattus norvegicus]
MQGLTQQLLTGGHACGTCPVRRGSSDCSETALCEECTFTGLEVLPRRHRNHTWVTAISSLRARNLFMATW